DDGDQEIVTANGIYGPTGTLERALSLGQYAIGNFDDDDEGEIIHRDGSNLILLDDDGTLLWRESAQGAGPPCVGDFDGDGEMEAGALGRSGFVVRDTDGSLMWSRSAYDASTGSMSCASFDFNGDGAAEVILVDRADLYIWDGSDGTQLYRNTNMASGSLYERAVVADVDNDGQAELIFPSNNYSIGGWDGVFVLGEANGQWAMARSTQNHEAYAPTQQNDDMTPVEDPDTPWAYGWRTNAPPVGPANAAPDWSLELLGVCEDCIEGAIELVVAVENVGSGRGVAGATLDVFAVDGLVETTLFSVKITDTVAPGVRLEPTVFEIPTEDIGPDGLLVEINGDSTFNECDITNNTVEWNALSCE
ncbi:MAG: FG-GAP-like repeat-containing protein, partial [Myxococcota bacterium]